MSQAFAALVPRFELLTQGSLRTFFKQDSSDIFEWYGVRQAFCIKRLPLYRELPASVARRNYFPRFIRAAVVYARLQRSAVVYTREFHVAYLATRWGIRTILENHGFSEQSRFHFLLKTMGNPRLLGIVTISNLLKECYVEQGVAPQNILVWPDAVDLSLFEQLPNKNEARAQLGIPSQVFLAVYAGHLYQRKGIQSVIEAARLVPEHQFLIVGGWPEDIERCQSLSAGLKNIRFVGFVPNSQVPLYLVAADALLLPNSEQCPQAMHTSPLKLFEYMAARRPIVASGIPAFRGLLKHGINSYLVEPDSGEALAEATGALAEDGELAARLSEQAWKDVRSYTWNKRAHSILQAFVPELLMNR